MRRDLIIQKKLLSEGEIAKVLENLLIFFQEKDTKAYNSIVMQSCIYIRLKEDQLANVLSPESFRREELKVIVSLLEIIDNYMS